MSLIPTSRTGYMWLDELVKCCPVLSYIIDSQTDVRRFNKVLKVVKIIVNTSCYQLNSKSTTKVQKPDGFHIRTKHPCQSSCNNAISVDSSNVYWSTGGCSDARAIVPGMTATHSLANKSMARSITRHTITTDSGICINDISTGCKPVPFDLI